MTYNELNSNNNNVSPIVKDNGSNIFDKYGLTDGGKDFSNLFNKDNFITTGNNDPFNLKKSTPSAVPNMATVDFRDNTDVLNKANENMENHSYADNFAKRNNVNVGNIKGIQGVNLAVKNSKSSINKILPDILSNVSKDVNRTVENLSTYFGNVFNDIDQKGLENYLKLSNLFAKKANIDMEVELQMINNWMREKDIEYSNKGIENEIDAMETEQKYAKYGTFATFVATVASLF